MRHSRAVCGRGRRGAAAVYFVTLVVCLAAIAAVLWLWQEETKRAAALEREVARLQEQLSRLAALQQEKQAETPGPEAPQPGPTEASAAEAPAPPAVPEGFDPSKLLESMLGKDAAPDAAGGMLARMFEGPQGEAMAENAASMMLNMQYNDLFAGWSLPRDAEEQVRAIFKRYMKEQVQRGMRFLKEKPERAVVKADMEALDAQMREELAQILTPEQMAEFEAYEEGIPARMLEQSYDMQLRMFGAGLTEENREFVKQVLVDEMLAYQPDPRDMPDPEQMREFLAHQDEVYNHVLEQVSAQMDEEQVHIVERFIEQQRAAVEYAGGFMGEMFGNAEEPAPQ